MTSSSSLYGTVNTQNASSTNSTSLYGGADTPIPDASGNLVVRGDLYVLSGNILTTAGTGNIFPANATTINLGNSATAVNIGAATGTTTINNDLLVDGNLTVNGVFTAPDAQFGNITIAVATNNTITTTTGGLILESATGEIDTGSSVNISTNSTTFGLLNSPTTVNAFQGATALTMGAASGTTNINNDLTVDGDNINLAQATIIGYSENNDRLNRPTVKSTTGNTSGWRVNAPNATTSALSNISAASSNDNNNNKFIGIQARGAATNDLRIQTGKYTAGVQGPSGTVVTFQDFSTPYATVNPAGPTNALDLTTKAYVDAQVDANTTYTVDASTTTGGANFNLVGSDASTDTIKIAGGTNVTVTATDANTITITSVLGPGTTYDYAASSATGGANLNLAGSDLTTDTVKLTNAGHVTATYTSATEVTLGSDATDANTASTIVARDASGNFSAGTVSLAGQLIDTQANNPADGAGQIFLNGANGNRIDWAAAGTGAPAFTTRTTGTKAVLYPSLSGSTTDYALGIDAATMWSSIPENNDSFKFKWYGATTQVASLSGTGNLVLVGDATIKDTLTIEGATSGSVALTAPAVAGTQAYTLPTALPGVSGYVLAADTSGVMSWVANPDTNTTYTIDASTTTGGANLNLVGSDASTDTVKFAEGAGIDIVQTDANTITVASTITQYTDALARAAISGTSPIGYDNTTGVITFTPTPTLGSVLTGNGTTWTNSNLGVSAQYTLNRNTTGATGSNQILLLSKTRTDGTRTNGQGPSQVYSYTGTDGGYNFARISTGYQSGGVHTMSFALSTDTTGNFGAGTSTPLTFNSTGGTFTSIGRFDVIRNGAVAAAPSGILLQYRRTDVAGPQNADGIDFRLGVGGTATTSNFARFDGGYSSAGDNEIGMSVSVDSFAADTDRIYIGSRARTRIQTTPAGGGTTGITADFTQLATTLKTDSLVLQNAAGVGLIGSSNISYNRVYGQWQYDATLTPAAADTAYAAPFQGGAAVTDFANIASAASTSRIIFGAAGMYKLQFSAQVQNSDNGADHQITFWWRKNGTDVPNSAGYFTVPKAGAADGALIVGWDNMASSDNATDYYELMYAVSDIALTLPYIAAAAPRPAAASVFLTLVPIGA